MCVLPCFQFNFVKSCSEEFKNRLTLFTKNYVLWEICSVFFAQHSRPTERAFRNSISHFETPHSLVNNSQWRKYVFRNWLYMKSVESRSVAVRGSSDWRRERLELKTYNIQILPPKMPHTTTLRSLGSLLTQDNPTFSSRHLYSNYAHFWLYGYVFRKRELFVIVCYQVETSIHIFSKRMPMIAWTSRTSVIVP